MTPDEEATFTAGVALVETRHMEAKALEVALEAHKELTAAYKEVIIVASFDEKAPKPY